MTLRQKINVIAKILTRVVYNPKLLFEVLKDETVFEKYLQKKYRKTLLPTVDLREFLEEDSGKIEHFTFLDGSSLVTDLVLLRSLAKSIPDCDYLEIGMWRGESVMNVAQEAKTCTTVNLSAEEIVKMKLPEKYAKLHGCLINNQDNIKIVYANSMTFDFSSLNQKYDLIFVDGDHHYEAVKSDTQKVFPLLKDDNSIIVWHDYAYNPEKPRHSVIAGILDGLPPTAHQYLYHVSNTISAIYTKRKIKSDLTLIEPPVTPDKIFRVEISAKSLKK
ncbi:MAG: class I SAM-dependent methyltransferase [Prevotellaceae bacterium]|jgi:predicted O-methyltransferase YrrM|nr:class I SAM-dependent methyltransferase [Prevotellaceae bacterium]